MIKVALKVNFILLLIILSMLASLNITNITTLSVNASQKIFEQNLPVGIYLNENQKTFFELNETFQLKATFYPETNNYKVTWYSLDPKIAKVDSNGVVTTCGTGSTRIVAKYLDFKAMCEINVHYPQTILISHNNYSESEKLEEWNIELVLGETTTITFYTEFYDLQKKYYTVIYDNDNISHYAVMFNYNTEVPNKRVIKGEKIGYSKIEVKIPNGKTAICNVKVVGLQTFSCSDILDVNLGSTINLQLSCSPNIKPNSNYLDFKVYFENDALCSYIIQGISSGYIQFKGLKVGITNAKIKDSISGVEKAIKINVYDDKANIEFFNKSISLSNMDCEISVTVTPPSYSFNAYKFSVKAEYNIDFGGGSVIGQYVTIFLNAYDLKGNFIKKRTFKNTFEKRLYLCSRS